jgi:nickel-dependent lactate racemase
MTLEEIAKRLNISTRKLSEKELVEKLLDHVIKSNNLSELQQLLSLSFRGKKKLVTRALQIATSYPNIDSNIIICLKGCGISDDNVLQSITIGTHISSQTIDCLLCGIQPSTTHIEKHTNITTGEIAYIMTESYESKPDKLD